jgi:transglutaminase-like putative cysteine protease
VRSSARTVAAAAPAVVVVAAAWLRLEQPLPSLWRPAALVVLAVSAAALPRRGLRAAGVVIVMVAAAWLALRVAVVPRHPLDPASGFGLGRPLNDFGTRFGNGFLDFYDTHLPFDPRVHAEMAGVVLVAAFCFALLVALLVASRSPIAAMLALLIGAGWPATLLGPSHAIGMGLAILAAGLVLLAALTSRHIPILAVPAAGIVVIAAVVAGSATAARRGAVAWQQWDPAAGVNRPARVSFVWTSQYAGLDWPTRRTVVLSVQAPKRPAYLRAAVLDDFVGDAWQIGALRAADSLEPTAAFRAENDTRQVVTVEGLVDTHLAGGSIPIRFDAGGVPIVQTWPGFATLPAGLARGFRYTVWSYTPRPTVAELRRAPPDYPAVLVQDGLLDVGGGITVPAFGSAGRAAAVANLTSSAGAIHRYAPLAQIAEQVAGGARTPYDAVAALEEWFLVSGHFQYSDHPAVVAPPLVGFVTKTRSGYCQYFAGAMALMLRYLGIPARVAVGFASGSYDASTHAWRVTDHDAHAWVEVWFPGFGWLPFDPTPAVPGSSRGHIAQGTGAAPVEPANPNPALVGHGPGNDQLGKGTPTRKHATLPGVGFHLSRSVLVLFVLLAAFLAAGTIAATKLGVRLVRRVTRDPRRIAAACRLELAAFLVDQRIETARNATLHELGELVRAELGVDAGPFVAAAAAARFDRAARAETAAGVARRELRSVLRACRRSLTPWERLRGSISLRSLSRVRSLAGRSASLGDPVMESTGT